MKKSKFKKLAATACALCMIVPMACMSFTACGDGNDNSPPVEEEVAIVTSITLNTSNVKTVFNYKEEFTYTGLTVTANLSDGTSEVLPLTMCSVSTVDTSVPGNKVVTVSYKNIKSTYNVTVRERQMPTISSTPLATINGDNVYKIEAEAIDLVTPGVKAVGGKDLIVDINAASEETEAQAEEEAIVSGGKYLANYGVEDNYFGFTFTADKEYKNATLVFRVANPTTSALGIGANMNVYLNYRDSSHAGQLDISDVTALDAAKKGEDDEIELEWSTRILRGVTIPEGTNTLTFDVLGENVVCIDYFEIYAGVAYGTNSVTELNSVGTVIKDVEDFDLEKIVVRKDIKDHHHLPDGVAFVETPSSNVANTHEGRSVGAMAKGSEITTALRLEEDATVHILYSIASVDGYKVKDNYEFYIDGEKLENVEDYFVKAGDAWKQGSQFWEWRDTSIGYVDLEAGDHIFTVKVTGQDCNCDVFKFEVLSYGEFTAHPEQSGKINVDGLGTYVMEAENIDMFYATDEGTWNSTENKWSYSKESYIKSGSGITEGYYRIGSADNCSNGRFINTFEAGSKFIFTILSYEDTKVDINMRAVRPNVEDGASVAESLKLYLGETEIPVSTTADALHNTDWKTITLAEDVSLEGGKLYTFTMEITDPFWLDNISFVTSEYNGVLPSLGSIKLDTSAVKKEYDVNETLLTEGLTVTGVMTNGVTFPVELSGCSITTPDMATAGEKTVKVEYEGKQATYKIIVHGPVTGITLNTEAAKKEYNFGDAFSMNGVLVIADTGAGTTKTVALDDCTVTKPNMLTVGAQTISVTYGTFEATYEITVNAAESEVVINGNGDFDKMANTLKKDGVVTRPDFVPSIGQGNYGVGGGGIYGFTAGTVFNVIVETEEDCTVTIAISLHSDQSSTFGENFEFMMDGVVLTQLNPNDSMLPNDSFHSTVVVTLQLTKGQHAFSMKVLQTHFDLEKITFTASEYGATDVEEGTENPPALETILNEEND